MISARISARGTAVSDGYITIYLRKKSNKEIAEDVNGKLSMFTKKVKAGDKYGFVELLSILSFNVDTELEAIVEYNLGGQVLTIGSLTEGVSGIMIHDLDATDSLALIKYELDTRQNILYAKHDFTQYIESFSDFLADEEDLSERTILANTGNRQTDGWGLENLTDVKVSITNNVLQITDASAPCFFGFGYVLPAEETYVLRDKQIFVDVELDNNNADWIINFAKWTGDPDNYNSKIIDSSSNQDIILTDGWELLPENTPILPTENSKRGAVTVPTDTNNIALFIRSKQEDQPMALRLKSFDIGMYTPQIFYTLYNPELLEETIHDKSQTVSITKANKTGMTYYAKSTWHFLPLGTQTRGGAPVEFVEGAWSNAGYNGFAMNTNVKALQNGVINISNTLNVTKVSIPAGMTEITVSLMFIKLKDGATGDSIDDYDELPDTLQTFTVDQQSENEYEYTTFKKSISVQANDQIALKWKSNSTSDFSVYVSQEKQNIPIVSTTIEFEKYVTENIDMLPVLDTISELQLQVENLNNRIKFTQDAIDTATKILVDNPNGNNPSVTATTEEV